jgi:hypothetical protein
LKRIAVRMLWLRVPATPALGDREPEIRQHGPSYWGGSSP